MKALTLFKKIKPFPALLTAHLIVIILAVTFLFRGEGEPSLLGGRIVVIPIEGVISMEPGALRHGIAVDSLVRQIEKFSEDKEIKAIVLRINSPGGTVGAVQELHRALMKFRQSGKKIVSSFGEVSASGGYYLAAAGDKIVLNPGTLTGSIGVVMQIPNVTGLFEKVGIRMNVIKSGDMKDVGSPFRTMSTDERDFLQKLIMDSYGQFFEAVKTGRSIETKKLKPLADGRIFTGRMAVENGLADSLGGLPEAIDVAKKISGLDDMEPNITYYRGRAGLDQFLHLLTRTPVKQIENLASTEIKLLYMMQ